ncbi:MAG: amino acid permease [Verrucomicrobiaceae bacterium]|nr:amino acid permease [Verrucomicrobiaceae bacterium]
MRVVGVPGAVLMGLGSILGTGIFVSLGIAAGVAGPSVILAVAVAAGVATCNGLSSAQLAASHPVSGGTYEYGYRYLNPALGFTAGWMFLCAKSASAATAALGFAGYVLVALGQSGMTARIVLALAAIGLVTGVVASGMHRSNRTNAVIVSLTLAALLVFVLTGIPSALDGASLHLRSLFEIPADGVGGLLHATALMFVAYTGYGRIATLGEEIRDPRRSIPKAIVLTLLATMGIYVTVAFVAVAAVGAPGLAEATLAAAPLEVVARGFGVPGVAWLVAAGAVTAMLGVLLNLLLGLSRVLLAMSRRGDMPTGLARLDGEHASPRRAVIAVAVLVAALAMTGNVGLTWSFSAFTVLVYYALTNLAALRLPAESRLYPRWVPVCGLVSCLGLAFWVEPAIWLAGLALIGAGLLWHKTSGNRFRNTGEG